MKHLTSRRHFLKTAGSAAALTGSLGFPAFVRGQNLNSKLQIASIGVGGKGSSDNQNAAEDNVVVGICDVDAKTLGEAKKRKAKWGGQEVEFNKDAETFSDFREMLSKLGSKIDAVTVSTPDHTHYPAAMAAIKLGKHVMVQKPLVNTLWEADELRKAAKKKGVTTVMGNQGHTGEGIRVLKEWMQQGAIGKVKEVHVWTNRPIWPQGVRKYKQAQAPAGLNWEAWQSSVPDRPYMEGLAPFAWRGHLDYGAGAMGDMGCHIMDGPFWACELGTPSKMQSAVTELTEESWPKGSHVVLEFPEKEVQLHWYEGKFLNSTVLPERPIADMMSAGETMLWNKGKEGDVWVPVDRKHFTSSAGFGGFMIVGEKGTILNFGDYCDKPFIVGEKRHKDWLATNPKKTLERSLAPGNPQLEWTRAIKQGKQPGSNFEYAVPLTEICLFGNLAIRANGEAIEWDKEKREIKGHPEMTRFIKRTYRAGWEISADQV